MSLVTGGKKYQGSQWQRNVSSNTAKRRPCGWNPHLTANPIFFLLPCQQLPASQWLHSIGQIFKT